MFSLVVRSVICSPEQTPSLSLTRKPD
jgi:hypothetical protein